MNLKNHIIKCEETKMLYKVLCEYEARGTVKMICLGKVNTALNIDKICTVYKTRIKGTVLLNPPLLEVLDHLKGPKTNV